MSPRNRAVERRREILEALYGILVDEGLQGTSLARIAKRIKIPSSLVLHYFGTKEEMFRALVDYMVDRFTELQFNKLQDGQDPAEQLSVLLDLIFSRKKVFEDTAYFAIFYLSLHKDVIRDRLVEMHKSWRMFIVNVIERAVKAGIIKGQDPGMLADFLITFYEGLAVTDIYRRDPAESDELRRRFKEQVSAMLQLESQPW